MDSITLEKYKQTMFEYIQLYFPNIKSRNEIEDILNYSINKRLYKGEATIENSYTRKSVNMDLLRISDYIASRGLITTPSGCMFMNHESDVPNPMKVVIQQFLDNRKIYKDKMFTFPKGSEEYEHYNLMQQLSKIDVNGCYGALAQNTCLIYNLNVANSITAGGRGFVSTMSLFFESFLANSVKFGSLNEVLDFINNTCKEKPIRKFNDWELLDNYITPINCFTKVVMSCGYRWIPNNDELEIIWQVINNLGQQDLNRVYYKNNIYEFCKNSKIKQLVIDILQSLDQPFLTANNPPKNIIPLLDSLTDLLREFVYYRYMYEDRIDRNANMIKSIIMVSDTDSTIISLDAWYRFILEFTKDINMSITKYTVDPLYYIDYDEFGDMTNESRKKYFTPVEDLDPQYDYDFFNDELIELKHTINPIEVLPQDSVRHSIINILAYVLDKLVNDYMMKACENSNSYDPNKDRPCKIIAKNEFTFRRLLMTPVAKSYASIQELQEGHIVPEEEQLDIKGIASMAKSSMADSTRDALKKILLEDIMNANPISQFTVIKHIAILERQITDSLYAGSKEFYKPVTIKSASSYQDPMRIQGIKASVVWNTLRDPELPAINLDERNAVSIVKIKISKESINNLMTKYPEVYDRFLTLCRDTQFSKNTVKIEGSIYVDIDSIAIPLDVEVPKWLMELIDFSTIVNDNIGGFVYDSIGIKRFGRNKVNYTNILQL